MNRGSGCTSTPARQGSRRPSAFFNSAICTPIVMKIDPKKAAARRAVTLQTIPETTDDQPTNLAPQIEEGECVSVLEIPQTAVRRNMIPDISGLEEISNAPLALPQETSDIQIVHEVRVVKTGANRRRKSSQKKFRPNVSLKTITKYKNRSIKELCREPSHSRDRTFNQSLQRYYQIRKESKKSKLNRSRRQRDREARRERPHRPRQSIGTVFDPNSGPLMNFANTGQGLFRFGGAGNSQRRKRPIIIDGQNVAVEHGKERSRGKLFSARGIEIVVEYFKLRGHGGEGEEIVAWLPRKLQGNIDFPDNKRIMDKLEDERHIKYTMDRSLQDGRRLKSYDDRSIVQDAATCQGIILSNDNYRDLVNESREMRRAIEERLLQFNFRNDRFFPTPDPLGRGSTLENFLEF